MRIFKLEIELENQAFDGLDCTSEIARILEDTATRIVGEQRDWLERECRNVKDCNGNTVGYFNVYNNEQ